VDRAAWDARYAAAGHVWGAEPNRFVVEVVEDRPPGRALDLACGEGRNAVWLARRGWRVTGVDFSPVALAKAAELAAAAGLAAEAVELVEADVLEWRPPSGAFDLVLVAYLHLPEPHRRIVLERAAGAVAPGGICCILGHDRANLADGVGGPQDPAVLPTAEELAGVLGAVGLEVRRAQLRTREVDTPDGPRTAIDHLVVASRPAG
jgi:SAM-dependent methyltransferase